MKWRNPKVELPVADQRVFVMLEAHKERAESIEIVGGETWYPHNGGCFVENNDELGLGSKSYVLVDRDDYDTDRQRAVAWIPLEEFPFPDWVEKI